ncbi:amino acid deaminase/aldolase [Streptomyces calidiresistens]|uniref:Amino acid deaminase/aldolase n=1 Tax=Streptomyces calidiresistens TaxID=1485586 RepID=A0A7W3XWR6_9ACTN|nr:amino acid deaminase/aldolase [Streptomyces calidiresistens]MBB0230017.1 amino acid deaminase/aldolase [Streptomyces calidiresistens]
MTADATVHSRPPAPTPGETVPRRDPEAARRAVFHRLERATADLEPPFAVVDLSAWHRNADALTRRALAKPLRVATKSLRCRSLIRRAERLPGWHGALAFTLPEALLLAADGPDGRPDVSDVVVGYPTADRAALRRLATDPAIRERVTLMVDHPDHLDHLEDVLRGAGRPDPEHPLRLCLELDASLRLFAGRVHIGARRSPVHDPASARVLAEAIVRRPGLRLVGMMAYEAQIAGVGDAPAGAPLRALAIRGLQRLSAAELRERRAAAVAAVRSVTPLEFVNGGGTGSVARTAAEPAVTEIAAGSGLYGPALFDGYRDFRPAPAAFFALPVVRRPAPGVVTVLGGGWTASGPPGRDRLPVPVFPPGLRYVPTEAAGEVQTPLVGAAARDLRPGDRVWFRHAKAGEPAERVNRLHLVEGDRIVEEAPTYRGEGHAFI